MDLKQPATHEQKTRISMALSLGAFTGEWLLTWGRTLSENNVIHLIGLLAQIAIYVWMLIRTDKMITYPINLASRIAGYVGVVAGAIGLYMAVMLLRYIIYTEYASNATRTHSEDALSFALMAFLIGVPALVIGLSGSLLAGNVRPGVLVNVAALVIGLVSLLIVY